MKIYILCKPYLLRHKFFLIAYIAIVLLTSAIRIISPYIIGSFLDALISGTQLDNVLRFSAIFGGLNIIKIAIGYVSAIMHTQMQSRMSHSFNMDTIRHLQKVSLSYVGRYESAYLSQRIHADTGNLIYFCIGVLQGIITNAFMLVVPFVILLSLSWQVTVLLMGFIALYFILYFVFRKALYNVSIALKEAQSKFNSCLYEQFKYIRLIKQKSIQKEINSRADTGFSSLLDKIVRSQKVSNLYSGLGGFVSTMAQILLFVAGGLLILWGHLTIGMFTIFTSFFGMILSASQYFIGIGAHYQNSMAAYDRIMEFYYIEQESCGATLLEDISKIELRNINFAYSSYGAANVENKKTIIKNFSAYFSKGKIYCIAGANGSGKSTLVNLLMGLYVDEFAGQISYDGVSVNDIDMTYTRKKLFGFAEQEPLLISDTIKYNLDVGQDEAFNSDSINKWVQVLGMKDFFLINIA